MYIFKNIQTNKHLTKKMAVTPQKTNKQPIGNYTFSEIAYICISNWYWFVACVVMTLSYTIYNIVTTQPVYTRHAEILIKSGKKGFSIDEQMENFANMGTFRPTTNATNEIYTFKAPETILETVKRLKLYIQYSKDGALYPETLYGETVPVSINLCDKGIEMSASLDIDVNPDKSFKLYNFKGDTSEGAQVIEGNFDNDSIVLVSSPLGDIILENNTLCLLEKTTTIHVNQIGLQTAAAKYGGKISYSTGEEDSDLIKISISDHSIERADDILETIIAVYNENWVKDKNKAAEGTGIFINERLQEISEDLDIIENNISSYKSSNLLPNPTAQASLHISKEKEVSKKINGLKNELEVGEYILSSIRDKARGNNLLPINSGINNMNINTQIASYNTAMIERNNLVSRSSINNPAVKDMDITLSSIQASIISSVETYLRTLRTQISSLEQERRNIQGEISKNPEQTTYLASAEREQGVKEKIYLFLLQKREENQLSQAFNAYKTRIITPPTGSLIPTSPEKKKSITHALLIGLLVPALILIVKELSNTKVRGRKDLENLTTPIIGEIPLVDNVKNKIKKGKSRKDEKIIVAVEDGSRNIINEAFRVLRTNIEFMTRGHENNTIIYTSFNPMSGKTFCILNTAISIAIKGEKVLIIDGDMRHASLSTYIDSPDKGLSKYLAKDYDTAKEVTVVDEKHSNLHIIPAGATPPNPTELLESNRFEKLLNEVKNEYKYIFIDCPPVEIVADTHIIEKFATNTIFLIRSGLLERSMLNEIEEIYKGEKFKNLSIILNGVDTKGNKYGYRYGYRYGYHYGSYTYGSEPAKKRKGQKI